MKNHLVKIFKEAGFTVAGSFMKSGIGFVMTAIIARAVAEETYGVFTQAFTLISIGMVIASLGIPQAYTRYIPQYIEEGKEYMIPRLIRLGFTTTIAFSLLLALGLFAAAPLIGELFHDPELSATLRWMVVLLPLLIWIRNMLYVFIGYKELRYGVYVHRFIIPTGKLIIMTVLFWLSYQMSALIISEVAATVIAVGVLYMWYKQRITLPEDTGATVHGFAREIIGYSLPLVLSQMMLLALSYADILMLGLYLDSSQVGIYKVILNGAYLTTFMHMSLASIYKPVVSGLLAQKDKTTVAQLYKKLNTWGIFFNAFLILVVALFGKEAIRLAFTGDYVVGYSAMLILAVGYMASGSFGQGGPTLEAIGKTKTILALSVGVSLLNVMLNAILIPQYGLDGGAYATAIAASLMSILYALNVYRIERFHPFSIKVLAGIVSFSVLLYAGTRLGLLEIQLGWVRFIAGVLLLGVLYVFGVFLLRGFTKKDFAFLLDIVKKRKKA